MSDSLQSSVEPMPPSPNAKTKEKSRHRTNPAKKILRIAKNRVEMCPWKVRRVTGMYGPPLGRKAKSEDATSWSARMYTAFVGVDHSWPGWNALRSLPH